MLRRQARTLFAKQLSRMSQEQIEKYLALLRVTYFFSASSFFFLVVHRIFESRKLEREQQESGKPFKSDDNIFTRWYGATEVEYIWEHDPKKGWLRKEYKPDDLSTFKQDISSGMREAAARQKSNVEEKQPADKASLVKPIQEKISEKTEVVVKSKDASS